MFTAYWLTAYVGYHYGVAFLNIDRVGLDDGLLFPASIAFAAVGACAVGDLHYLDGVVGSVGQLGLPEGDGDGGDFAEGVAVLHHHLFLHGVADFQTLVLQLGATETLSRARATGPQQGTGCDEGTR